MKPLMSIALLMNGYVFAATPIHAATDEVELGSAESSALEAKTRNADCVGHGAPIPGETYRTTGDKIARRAKQITEKAGLPCSVVNMVWINV